MPRKKFVWCAAPLLAFVVVAVPAAAEDAAIPPIATPPIALQPTAPAARPAALVPLYISFAALQAADAATTLRNVNHGATEANPVMGGMVGSPAGFIATKAALATVSIYCTERLWKKNRAAAIAVMIGLNGVSAAVVARNYATRTGR